MIAVKTVNGNTATLTIGADQDVMCEVFGRTFRVVRRAHGFDSRDGSVRVAVDRNWIGDAHNMINSQAKMHPLLRAALIG